MNFEIGNALRRSWMPAWIPVGVVAGLSLCVLHAPALAAQPEWPSGTYKYITIDQPVGDALKEFGRNIGIPVEVSKRVGGRLGAGMPIGTAREFLDWVCDRYGLVWYYDGSILHVAAVDEMRTEMVKLSAGDTKDVHRKLDSLGIADPRYPVRVSDAENVMSVSGPPAYVSAVKRSLGIMSGPVTSHIAREVDASSREIVPVRVFRGKRLAAENVPAGKSE
ncbi:type III secretion protein [Nitratireductor sp. ZSWI3]|uniref:type III secretion protein n=1 Tax=Nitratireductor sp. ZSWI3 TaxID=2966359 RepID=UPI00215031F7|nr:type III secretion protein [Nitratireductor sp. ZSWI3]MCR4264841.1 type III secretion protein [Nitratireductor sp. ZSWI3]